MTLKVQVTKQGQPIIIPSAELYNIVMQSIEPELTSASLQSLDFLLKDKSPIELQASAHRYEKAFTKFYEQLKEYNGNWQQNLQSYKKNSRNSLEEAAQTTELQSLQAFFL